MVFDVVNVAAAVNGVVVIVPLLTVVIEFRVDVVKAVIVAVNADDRKHCRDHCLHGLGLSACHGSQGSNMKEGS